MVTIPTYASVMREHLVNERIHESSAQAKLKKNDHSIAVDQKNPRGGFGWGRSMVGLVGDILTRSYHVGWMKFSRGF
jgi:hypothetical protein